MSSRSELTVNTLSVISLQLSRVQNATPVLAKAGRRALRQAVFAPGNKRAACFVGTASKVAPRPESAPGTMASVNVKRAAPQSASRGKQSFALLASGCVAVVSWREGDRLPRAKENASTCLDPASGEGSGWSAPPLPTFTRRLCQRERRARRMRESPPPPLPHGRFRMRLGDRASKMGERHASA